MSQTQTCMERAKEIAKEMQRQMSLGKKYINVGGKTIVVNHFKTKKQFSNLKIKTMAKGRLVTVQDIHNHPELSKRGISVNQYHDFDNDPLLVDDEEEEDDDENDTEEKKVKKVAAKKAAPKKGKKK